MTDARRILGTRGEDIAADYFLSRGYEIVERNWRKRVGEMDLIIQKDDELRFVEVKTRYSLAAGYPEESVTRRKLAKLEQLALDYLDEHPDVPQDFHLDVLALIIDSKGRVTAQYLPDIGIS